MAQMANVTKLLKRQNPASKGHVPTMATFCWPGVPPLSKCHPVPLVFSPHPHMTLGNNSHNHTVVEPDVVTKEIASDWGWTNLFAGQRGVKKEKKSLF